MKNFPNIAVDVALFSYFEDNLNILLIRRNIEPFRDCYAFPGVLLRENETAEEGAIRALTEEANVNVDYLEQLYTFTDINRDPRKRIISISYYGLVNQSEFEILNDNNAKDIKWWSCAAFPQVFDEKNMAFDHHKIYQYALARLKSKIQYEPIGIDLLPQYFTMTELHRLYSVILDRNIDRRNFTRKIQSYGLIVKTGKKTSGHLGRQSQLFEFDNERYNELKKSGIYFEI